MTYHKNPYEIPMKSPLNLAPRPGASRPPRANWEAAQGTGLFRGGLQEAWGPRPWSWVPIESDFQIGIRVTHVYTTMHSHTHYYIYIYIIKGAFTKVSVFNMFGFFRYSHTHTYIYTVYVCMLYMYVIYLNRCGWCGASIAMVASLGISKVWLMDRCICKIHQAAMIGASWGLPVPNPPYNCRNVLKNSMQAGGCCESSIRSICWFCWGLLLRQIRGIGMRNSS